MSKSPKVLDKQDKKNHKEFRKSRKDSRGKKWVSL